VDRDDRRARCCPASRAISSASIREPRRSDAARRSRTAACSPSGTARPGERADFPAKDVVDAGFLELVRYGIRKAGDPLVEDSLRVIDAVLKVETPYGPCWRRYNHDGYGQRADGGAYEGWGTGRAWPLLTGERGHYELAAGRDPRPYLRAIEGFATEAGLLPEQVWDAPDRPQARMFLGRPTGAAMPLMWAHAEYIKLLRSTSDGHIFDNVPVVAERYSGRRSGRPIENLDVPAARRDRPRQARSCASRRARRFVSTGRPTSGWRTRDTTSTPTVIGVDFVDIPVAAGQVAPIRFTFYWTAAGRWEGRDFRVDVHGA
jgi:glucoamylase